MSTKTSQIDLELEKFNRFKSIFEYAPIAIWEEDFSALNELRDEIESQKVKNIRDYLSDNKELLIRTFRQLKVLDVNKKALELYGASTKRELLDNLGKTVHRDVLRILADEFTALLNGEEYFETEFKSKSLSGKIYEVKMRLRVPPAYRKNFRRVVITFEDITQQKKRERNLHRMAQTDGLTRVLNHTTVIKRLDEEFKRATRYKKDLSCLMVDLDHFKGINDLCGHQKGDKVLQRSAELITEHVREVDVVGRYGGDEFLVILPETPVDKATIVAERLINIFNELSSSDDPGQVFSTVSVGISGIPLAKAATSKDLISIVDKAMYKAKKAGRNTSAIIKT